MRLKLICLMVVFVGALCSASGFAVQDSPKYVCPPCPGDCHDKVYDKPGRCDGCGMILVRQASQSEQQAQEFFAAQDWAKAAVAYEDVVKKRPDDGMAWFRYGYALHATGQLDKALRAHNKAAEFDQFRGIGLYNAACVYSMTGRKDEAIAALEKSLAAGFVRPDAYQNDTDLNNIRTDRRFQRLLAQVTGGQPPARNVAIFVHEGVELLDFAGPGEVFEATRTGSTRHFNVYTVAATKAPIVSQRFVTVTPQYTFADCPSPDIVVLPGGNTRRALDNAATMEWVKNVAEDAEIVLSVCTGALILAEAKLLDGQEATTHHLAINALRQRATRTKVHDNRRFIDNGKIVTSAGVSAGIDAALHVVGRLHGSDVAKATARYMEYDWKAPN